MKPSMNMRMVAVAIGLALAGTLSAQTPASSQDAKKDMNAQKQDPMMMQESAPVAWTKVRGHEKGYVTLEEAMPNSWLATNFKPCDQNSDGKVTQAEYDQCRNKQP